MEEVLWWMWLIAQLLARFQSEPSSLSVHIKYPLGEPYHGIPDVKVKGEHTLGARRV